MGCHKPQKVNHVKHLLIILSLLILTFPLVAQEKGVLYLMADEPLVTEPLPPYTYPAPAVKIQSSPIV